MRRLFLGHPPNKTDTRGFHHWLEVAMRKIQDGSYDYDAGSMVAGLTDLRAKWSGTESFVLTVGDETTAIAATTAQKTFRMPYAFTLTAVRASLSTAQASGTIFTVDINDSGTTVLSTKLTIDNTEKTSTTAAAAAVISDTTLADDAEITIDVDQIGDSSAKGLKVILIGFRTI